LPNNGGRGRGAKSSLQIVKERKKCGKLPREFPGARQEERGRTLVVFLHGSGKRRSEGGDDTRCQNCRIEAERKGSFLVPKIRLEDV